MKINRQDTNGVKPLLAVGELGYDNYQAGGDKGRVYVGRGDINVPLANKAEADAAVTAVGTHAARVDNPHAVTKAQVGLGNVDNTSDSSKNVLSASKLTTARTITLTGDVTGSVSFDGTANASITATIASNSVALGIDTTGNYIADATAGNGIVITGTVGEGWNPTISLTDVGIVGTYRSVTTDAQGRVTAGTNPTTISGYGITDAYTKAELNAGQLDNRYYTETEIDTLYSTAVKLTGDQTVAGIKTFTSSPIVPTPTTDFQSVPLRSTNITVNVGAGQTYTTINQALEYLSGFYPMYKKSGITATINLKAGFVMAEQVLVSGIDLGWITIVGEDAETIITHTALTTDFNGANYPAFGVDKGGTSPVIGQLFRFNVEKVGGEKHGLMAYGAGSSAEVLSGKGFIGAGTNGVFAYGGSTINAGSANCSNAGYSGILAHSGSTINAGSANCSNAGYSGILAHSGSTINAHGANCSNAGYSGIYATLASTVSAYGANCSNAGTNGIYVIESSTITANGANCSNAGAHGIFAGQSSTVSAYGAIIQNQTTGIARMRVDTGSNIGAFLVNTTGGTVPVYIQAVNTLTANGIIYA